VVSRESNTQGQMDAAANLAPEGEEFHHLVVRLGPLDVRLGIEQELGARVLAEEGQRALHHLAPRSCPVLLQDRLLAVMGTVWKSRLMMLPS